MTLLDWEGIGVLAIVIGIVAMACAPVIMLVYLVARWVCGR